MNSDEPAAHDRPTLHSVDDGRGHRLTYYFRPAIDPPSSPLLIVFHGWTGFFKELGDYYEKYWPIDPGWNVLFPQDRYGMGRGGSWWLGEHGDFFMVPLINRMVTNTWCHYGIKPEALFTWGSSMGGYGALVHGMLARAKAICVSVPQVCLLGNMWNEFSRKYMEFVFGADVANRTIGAGPGLSGAAEPVPKFVQLFHDATNFIDYDDPAGNPLFLIAQSRFDMYERYFEEQTGYLVAKLLRARANFRLEVLPEQSHRPIWSCQRALELFAEHGAIIDNPLVFDPRVHADAHKPQGTVEEFLRRHPDRTDALIPKPFSAPLIP